MKILLVDDSQIFLKLLAKILSDAGYKDLVIRHSASEALEYLLEAPLEGEHEPVDLILMDVNMPGLGGIPAVRKIKSMENCRDIPIVMISGEEDEERIAEAFEAGAVDYIGKPFKNLELRARLRSIGQLKDERDRRKARERDLEKTVLKLESAISEIRTLNGLLPICSVCKSIRDDQGYWQELEKYLRAKSGAEFSHGLCPACVRELYPDIAEDVLGDVDPYPAGSPRKP